MALYLVQHGKSLSKEVDPEQGLSDQGTGDTQRIAEVARGYGVQVSLIRHSGKKRARQTAEIYAGSLSPLRGVQESNGLNPMDDVTVIAGTLRPDENLMLVGHLPFMERLSSYLLTGDTDRIIFRFQNAGVVCLDKEADKPFWFIKWALMPKIG